MKVGLPVQEFAERLDRGDHAGHHAGTVAKRWSAAEQAADFGLEAGPGARAQLSQQLAVETRVQPQNWSFVICPWSVVICRGRRTTDNGQQLLAIRAADASEALLQIAALQ